MQHEIDRAERLPGGGEDAVDIGIVLHVAGQHELGADRLDEFPQPALHPRALGILVGEMGEAHLGPLGVQLLRDGPGDGVIVGDAENETLFSVEQTHGSLLFYGGCAPE